MKFCPNCGTQVEDGVKFCPGCGSGFDGAVAAPVIPAHDHTAEFDAQDISDNKVVAMLVYLTGWLGIIIAMLAGNTSKYAGFHVRQALKITVIETLLMIAAGVLFWIFIVPVLGWIMAVAFVGAYCVLFVVRIIAFIQICKGKAVEPPIVRVFGFLK